MYTERETSFSEGTGDNISDLLGSTPMVVSVKN